MQELTIESLLSLIGSLGTFAVVIWLLIYTLKSQEKKDEAQIKRGIQDDDRMERLYRETIEIIKKNTEVNEQLKNVLEKNTEATKTLVDRVTNVLISK